MTASTRNGWGSPTGGPRTVPFRMYRFYAEDGRLLYIGITGRYPVKRLMEHVGDKPWAAQMARWEVDPRVWASEAEALAVEKATIRAERPVYNWLHNEGNPDRRWAPPVRSVPYQPRTRYTPVGSRPSRLSPTARHRLMVVSGWAGAWLSASALLVGVAAWLTVPWSAGPALSGAVAAGLVWWQAPGRRRPVRRAVHALVAVALLVGAALVSAWLHGSPA